MTPKQQVKARHPGAYCLWDGMWWVYLPKGLTIGMGDTPQQAWADALRRMACTHPPTRL